MSTTVLGLSEDHFRSITVTSLAALAGIAAGLVSASVAEPKANLGVFIFAAFTLALYPVLMGLGIDVEDFSTKDHLYVAFMTFAMWFVTWTIILTSQASL